LQRGQTKGLDELRAVDAITGALDDVQLLIDRGEDPHEGAVSRILETPFDRGDHRL